ncbi:MAG: hypothetical protein K8J09_09770 [Planctomycetes bacterium]|nr:hypothetical protein [Planctomycetota bacterium]MCC7396880.1 hypothetical protein [Planctomycetota bacterium]
MMKPQTLLLLLVTMPFAACVNQGWRVDAGPIFVRTRGQVALQDAGGTLNLGDHQNHLQGAMGLGDTEPSPFIRAQWDQERHRVRLNGFAMQTEGSGVLASDFGGLVTGSQVTTKEDLYVINGQYSYELLRDRSYRLAAGGQLGFYSLDVAARSTAGYEQVNTQILMPMPFVEAELYYGGFTGGVNASLMGGEIRDASGRYWDIEAYGKLQLGEKFEVLGGYRYVLLDAYGVATGRDFDADLDIQGWFFGAGIKF